MIFMYWNNITKSWKQLIPVYTQKYMSKLIVSVPMYHPMKMQQLNGKRAINSLQVECNKVLIRCIAKIFYVLPSCTGYWCKCTWIHIYHLYKVKHVSLIFVHDILVDITINNIPAEIDIYSVGANGGWRSGRHWFGLSSLWTIYTFTGASTV